MAAARHLEQGGTPDGRRGAPSRRDRDAGVRLAVHEQRRYLELGEPGRVVGAQPGRLDLVALPLRKRRKCVRPGGLLGDACPQVGGESARVADQPAAGQARAERPWWMPAPMGGAADASETAADDETRERWIARLTAIGELSR